MRVIAPAMRLACINGVCAMLGWSPALAGGQATLGVGLPSPVFIPSPSYIPAPLALPPQANGAGVAPVQPLPPLILYSAPTLVLPSAPHERGDRRSGARR